jgi:hypothetical protein
MKKPSPAKAAPTARKPKEKTLLATMSVQIPSDVDERLTAVCAQSGLAKNLIARQAIIAAVAMMERDGGLFLPLSFPTPEE